MNTLQIILGALGVATLGLALYSLRRPVKIDPAIFTSDYAARLRKTMPDCQAEIVGDLELEVRLPGVDKPIRAYLNNAFREFAQSPQNRSTIIDRYLGALKETRRAAEPLDPLRILPVVRDRSFLKELAALPPGSSGQPMDVASETLNEELVVLYVADSEHSVRYLGNEDLGKTGIDRAQLRAHALENLHRLHPGMKLVGGKGVFMVRLDGTYESSMLLSELLWSQPELDVAGEPIAAVPTRDLLLITGSQEAAGLQAVRDIVEEATAQGAYQVSSKLFVRRDGRFDLFD